MANSGKINHPEKDKKIEKRPTPRSGKARAYDAKAVTGKRKSYCGG